MTDKIKDGATYDDVIAAPEYKIAEIVEGYLYLSPRPSPRHSNAETVLGGRINDAFQQGRSGPGGWWILIEPELHLIGDVLVPDIAGWRRGRLAELPEGPGVEVAPDWVCEVLSPSPERFDRRTKMPRYALAGIAYAWMVDPGNRNVEVYRRLDQEWILIESWTGTAIMSAPPFEAVPVDLAPLWL